MFRKATKKAGELRLKVAGDELVQDFISALTSRSIVESVKHEAAQSEDAALGGIAAADKHNNVYVTPGDISPEQQAVIAKASVNAHLQKMQAQQIEQYNADQLLAAQAAAAKKFLGCKVRVTVLDKEARPIETCWQDQRTGKLYMGSRYPKGLTGIIEGVDMSQNQIIITPTLLSRTIDKSIQYHIVYVVNPANLQPLISVSFLK